ncbi:MAG: PHP domain-containing protein [Alphaproteobacteria bacterium]
MQKFSYHTHTIFSDGNNTIEEMLLKAKELGWVEIGISDHLIVHKNISKNPDYNQTNQTLNGIRVYSSFDEAKEDVLKYIKKIKEASKKIGIKAYTGFEVDYFTYNGWGDDFKRFLKEVPCDYTVCGNHFFFDEECNTPFDIYNYTMRSDVSLSEIEKYLLNHYSAIKKAIASGLYTFLAHLDYAFVHIKELEKVNKHIVEDILSIIPELSKFDLPLELSTKGIRKTGDFFPAKWILDEVINAGVKIVISDDAHATEQLGGYFDKAEALLATYPNVKRFNL